MSVARRAVTVIGLGLIGGSIAKRLHGAGAHVSGVDPDADTRERAARDGICAIAPGGELSEQPELVFVAVPPEQTQACVSAALERWPQALVSDVASVKVPVLASLAQARDGFARYLPGHPLAGSASGGYAASDEAVFEGAVWALCPSPQTPIELAAEFGPFLDALGALALVCTADAHDRAVARTSHLPHVIAIALAAASLVDPAAMIATLSGGALRDGSRVAAADIELWWEILSANRSELLGAIEDFELTLAALKAAVATGNESAAAEVWSRGQEAHERILNGRWSARAFTDVAYPLEEGWAPWLALGETGTVLRVLRRDGADLRAQAS